jgi:hypothetical protein
MDGEYFQQIKIETGATLLVPRLFHIEIGMAQWAGRGITVGT